MKFNRVTRLYKKYRLEGFTKENALKLAQAVANHKPVFGLRASFGVKVRK